MSHFHNPPRLSPKGASRKPRTEPQHGKAPAKPSKANAAFNAESQRANAAGAVATAGQVVASAKTN
jgi:hypothetical protein